MLHARYGRRLARRVVVKGCRARCGGRRGARGGACAHLARARWRHDVCALRQERRVPRRPPHLARAGRRVTWGRSRSKPLPDLLGRHPRGYQLLRRHHAVGAATDPAVWERGLDRAARADRADQGGRRAWRAERRGREHGGRLTPRRGRMRALCHFAVVLQQRDDTVEQVCGGSIRSCTPTAPYLTGAGGEAQATSPFKSSGNGLPYPRRSAATTVDPQRRPSAISS
jgi:hypothetical protein